MNPNFRRLSATKLRIETRFAGNFICLLFAIALLFASSHSTHAQTGGDNPIPIGEFFNGVFPSEAPGSVSGFTTVNAFPNLRFIGPIWVTPYPGTNDLVVVGKSGHVWRFDNNPDVMPADVTVMLNISKYGDGVDLPDNVLPDGDHEPAVVNTPNVPSAPDMAFYNLTFHPNFGQSGMTGENHVYTSYSYLPSLAGANNDQYTYFRVTRFTVINDPTDGLILDPSSETVLIQQFDRDRNHQGGAMFFGDDGFLYISTGDGGFFYSNGTSERISQRLEGALMGGILRIDVDMQGGAVSHAIPKQPDDSAMKHDGEIPAGWPASYSANYMIPSDNPWVGTSSILEEFWAVGLRSPHSMVQDGVTGEIWIGDVGGNAEEIHLATAGDNFGWDYTNGGGEPQPSPLIGTDEPAILTIQRTVGTCVIGGHIYRGTEFPGLVGKLIYGDHVKGTISSLDYTFGQPVVNEFLCDFPNIGTKAGLSNICPGPNDEVFMPDLGGFDDGSDIEDNDGTIQRLATVNLGGEPPALLSQTGAFLDLVNLTPHPAFLPYDVLAPLWSDNSRKGRWIAVPNDGIHNTSAEKITFSDKDNWVFPEGTVLMKHFELPNDETDPTSTVRLETRFIICTTGGGKYGFTYRWLPDQSDATLLATGETGDYQIAETGGGSRTQTWQFPSRSDCLQCHNNASGQALGVRTNQLNGFFTDPSTGISKNQLLEWDRLGMFDVSLTPAQVADFLQSLPLDYTDAPIEHRVRSYLDSNCSHCHRPAGPGGNFDARLRTSLLRQGIINKEANMFHDPDLEDGLYIKPMDVANSIIHYRMDHALPSLAAMPPLAKNVVDEDAVDAVALWINSLAPGDFPPTPAKVRALLGGPSTTTGDINITIVLDDDVSDLTISDLLVTNGTILELTGSCHYYTAVIRPTGSPVGIDLPAGQVTADNYAVTNSASNSLVIPFTDSEPPVAEFIALPIDGEITGTTNIGIDFGKNVSGFSAGDLSVSNATVSNVSGSNGIHYFDITPFGPGEIIIDLAADAVIDSQSRGNAAASAALLSVLLDTDGDGLPDVDETTYGTNPNLADSDDDGLLDGAEVNTHGTNPNLADSDLDGVIDGTEIYAGSDPLSDTSLPPYTAPASLVSYYDFDDGSGDTALDTALSGTPENATKAQGTVLWDTAAPLIGDAALNLNGSTSLDSITPFDGSTTGFTISVWLKSDSFSETREGIINHRNNANSNMWGIAVVPATGGSDYRINTNNGGVSVPDGTFVTGQWQHVVFTWDGNAQTASVWVDGLLLSTATGVASTFTGFDNPWKIGDDPCCGGREMDGRLDDMAFFSEVLSESEITQIHTAGLLGLPVINAFQIQPFATEITLATTTTNGVDPASLVSYYNFDEGSGTTAADTASFGTAETATEAQGSVAWETGSPHLGSAALDLNGSTSLHAVTPLNSGSTAYTASFWIQPDTVSPHRLGLYHHRGPTNGEFWGISTASGGGTDNRIDGVPGNGPSGTISTGTWQHVAITWDAFGNAAGAPGLKGVSRTYVDGVLTSTLTNVRSDFNATANPWTIGDDPCCSDREFNGRMDDLGVFSKALSASAINTIYQAGLSGSTLPEAIQTVPMTQSSADNDDIALIWVSEAGATYSVLTTTDLSLPPEEWTILYNNVISQGASTSYVTPFSPSNSSEAQRFFRIMRN